MQRYDNKIFLTIFIDSIIGFMASFTSPRCRLETTFHGKSSAM